MNITHEKTTENVQELCIEIIKVDYEDKVDVGLKKYRRTAQIPGFRVGNAPMALIKRNYEKPLIYDEVNKIASETLNDYFLKNNINILLEPMLLEEKSTIDIENKEDFVFAFEFAMQPEFELDFASLPIMKVFKIEATKEEIEDYMNQIRTRHGDYINPETIEDNDYVTVNWEEKESGFFFVKDLTDKGKEWFLGKKMNDTAEISFSELFHSKENLKKFLKQTNEHFDASNLCNVVVKIASIGRVNPAEINETFFKKAFPDGSITTIEGFEKLAIQKIEAQWKQETNRKFMNDAITLLIHYIPMNLPEDFIKRYILSNNKDITEEKLSEEWTKYLESFQWQLIENKLGKDNNLNVSLEEIKIHIRDFYYQNYFMQFSLADVEERLNQLVEEAVKDQKQVKQLYEQIFEQKILYLLQTKMNVEELAGNFNHFFAFMAGKELNTAPAEMKPKKTRRSPVKKVESSKKKSEKNL